MKNNKDKIPLHLAIIMDGNRRWARHKGRPTFEGHRQGLKTAERVGEWCRKKGIKILTLWAFSTENWKRSKTEVNYLMNLIGEALSQKQVDKLQREGIRLQVIGERERLSKRLQALIKKAEEATKDNKEGVLNLAISYGGRAEILEAVRKIIKKKIPADKIDEEVFTKNLWSGHLPPPDLIIRTSGEQRLSGFLPWQGVYSEIYFSPALWPDFSEKDLNEALSAYALRHRRFGK